LAIFFTKLFYSDYIYPTARRDSIATDFPSVAAPDLDEIRKQPGTKQKKEKKRKDNKDIKKEIIDINNALKKERRVLSSKNIFLQKKS